VEWKKGGKGIESMREVEKSSEKIEIHFWKK
jgi:hypothetical protein